MLCAAEHLQVLSFLNVYYYIEWLSRRICRHVRPTRTSTHLHATYNYFLANYVAGSKENAVKNMENKTAYGCQLYRTESSLNFTLTNIIFYLVKIQKLLFVPSDFMLTIPKPFFMNRFANENASKH